MKFLEIPHALNAEAPLIYMWEIHTKDGVLVGRYVGKARSGARRPRTHYARNVANLLEGQPYRRGKPQGFRRVHHALAAAVRNECTISLRFLCNVGPCEDIDAFEQWHIAHWRCRGAEPWQLNG